MGITSYQMLINNSWIPDLWSDANRAYSSKVHKTLTPVLYEFIELAKCVHKDGPKYDHTKVFKIKGKLANALADSTGKQEYKNPNRGNDARKVVRELLVALQTEAARIHWSIFDEAVRTTTLWARFHEGAFR